jgi:hypothetical protein
MAPASPAWHVRVVVDGSVLTPRVLLISVGYSSLMRSSTIGCHHRVGVGGLEMHVFKHAGLSKASPLCCE